MSGFLITTWHLLVPLVGSTVSLLALSARHGSMGPSSFPPIHSSPPPPYISPRRSFAFNRSAAFDLYDSRHRNHVLSVQYPQRLLSLSIFQSLHLPPRFLASQSPLFLPHNLLSGYAMTEDTNAYWITRLHWERKTCVAAITGARVRTMGGNSLGFESGYHFA